MKRLVVGLVLFLSVFAVKAQYDPQALEILDAMSAKYKSINSFTADVSYVLNNEFAGKNEEFRGQLKVLDEMFWLKMDEQEIYNDGETQWTIYPEMNEVNIDYSDPESGDISLKSIYTMYKKGFKYTYLQSEKFNGVTCHVVDLVPENKDSDLFKIRLLISENDNLIKKWTLFEKQGSKYIYTITKFVPGANLTARDFKFDASNYSGFEIVDLR